MSSQCRNSSLSAALVLAVTCVLVSIGAPSAALAQPPPKKDCAQIEDVYEKLTCRQAAIADQMSYTSDTVFAEGTRLHQRTKPAHLAQIKNAKEKALRAKKKNTKETFKGQAKAETQGNKKGGHLVPFDDVQDDLNGDGICDYEQGNENAKCAAIELDELGNLQECNPKKKNKGKGKGGGNPKFEGLECDLFFDSQEPSTLSEEEDMEEAAGQLEATYSATEDSLIEMNEHLDIVNANLPDGPAEVLTAANGCVLPELTPGLAVAASALRGVHAALFGGARIATAWFGQDVIAFGFGGNARGWAATFDICALAANIAYITVDEIHKSESGELQVAIMNCVDQTAGDIAALQTQLAAMQELMTTQHGEIMNQLEEARVELVRILNTPHGQRETWPPVQVK